MPNWSRFFRFFSLIRGLFLVTRPLRPNWLRRHCNGCTLNGIFRRSSILVCVSTAILCLSTSEKRWIRRSILAVIFLLRGCRFLFCTAPVNLFSLTACLHWSLRHFDRFRERSLSPWTFCSARAKERSLIAAVGLNASIGPLLKANKYKTMLPKRRKWNKFMMK